jgi:cation diffusion facilitator CzcD-associated flavoprotein CzcO
MRILVIGAGIGGLTFVHSLRFIQSSNMCYKYTIDVVERSEAFMDGVGIVR